MEPRRCGTFVSAAIVTTLGSVLPTGRFGGGSRIVFERDHLDGDAIDSDTAKGEL